MRADAKKIKKLAIDSNLATRDQIEKAERRAKKTGKSLREILASEKISLKLLPVFLALLSAKA